MNMYTLSSATKIIGLLFNQYKPIQKIYFVLSAYLEFNLTARP